MSDAAEKAAPVRVADCLKDGQRWLTNLCPVPDAGLKPVFTVVFAVETAPQAR
jgi:hypothetical protein